MINRDFYRKLTDSLESNEVENLIEKLLESYITNGDKIGFVEALSEICERLTICEKLSSRELRNKVSGVIIGSWDREDFESTEDCTSIMITLHLEKAFEYFRKQIECVTDEAVRGSLIETYEEIGPYFKFWK